MPSRPAPQSAADEAGRVPRRRRPRRPYRGSMGIESGWLSFQSFFPSHCPYLPFAVDTGCAVAETCPACLGEFNDTTTARVLDRIGPSCGSELPGGCLGGSAGYRGAIFRRRRVQHAAEEARHVALIRKAAVGSQDFEREVTTLQLALGMIEAPAHDIGVWRAAELFCARSLATVSLEMQGTYTTLTLCWASNAGMMSDCIPFRKLPPFPAT